MTQSTPPLERRLTYRISRIHGRLNAHAARLLSEAADISLSQWRILVMMDTEPGITASEIVRQTKIDKAMVSRAIKKLAEDGLITVDVSDADQRQHVLQFTPRGRTSYERAWPHMIGRQNTLIAAITQDEHDQFLDTLDKLEDALRALERDGLAARTAAQ
ncbi:MAG: MarR family transcriptional regulator [Pseudomonadota bacterium]